MSQKAEWRVAEAKAHTQHRTVFSFTPERFVGNMDIVCGAVEPAMTEYSLDGRREDSRDWMTTPPHLGKYTSSSRWHTWSLPGVIAL
mmetsp:Transcript_23541/g.54726  ORF Transcript_23541/g.54726 Transcript_23541/m.54726 type:complete len:87 (+) Transcript_23541:1005-1265(+)